MSDGPQYGPNNPHPLSQVKTELIWEGKYDEYGERREVDIAGCDMPLQRVEAIDEPRSNAEGGGWLPTFEKKSRRQDDFRNRLIWGDNKLVMASLLSKFKGKIDLIYIDPPFDVGTDFSMKVPIGDEKETLGKDQSILESVAYKDMWGKNTDSYLHIMYERFALMKTLLSTKGSIYVHCDWHVNFLLRALLDELFGKANFLNELVWYYYNKMHDVRKPIFPRAHDTILTYAKSKEAGNTFNQQKEKRDRPVVQLVRKKVDGRMVNARDEDGNVMYRTTDERTVDDVWRIPMLQPADKTQNTGFTTQKNERILAWVIAASSNEGDLVADFFCGSGTTGAVAEKLGRRWIMADLGRFAVHTSRKRMIEIQRGLYDEQKPYRAFDVYNLGRYERQWWQKERLAGADEEHRRIVLAFYRAEPLTGATSPLLHGRKGTALVHVDDIDSLLTLGELKPIVEAAQAAGGKEVHCLAWEFEMELKRNIGALAQEYGVKAKLVRIPREVMEKNRRPGVDQVPFFEMASLAAEPVIKIEGGERIVDVELTNFLPSLSEVPGKELEALKERAVRSGFDFIDFWAVDFDHDVKGPFKHHWQDYRLRKDRSLKTASDCKHRYTDAKAHTICVKVIDVFGCDTSILLEVAGAGGLKSQSVTSRQRSGK